MSRALHSFIIVLCFATAVRGVAVEAAYAWDTYKIDQSLSVSDGLSQTAEASLDHELAAEYGASFRQLLVDITPETATRLHVKLKPAGQQRWEVPETMVPRPKPQAGLSRDELTYDFKQLSAGQPFALTLLRSSDGSKIFDTTGHRFLFKDQYIELTTSVPEDADLYGLGEFTNPQGLMLPRDGRTLSLWARDISCANEWANLYGAHPFYVQTNGDGTSHGVLLLNSNGMDVTVNPTSLTFKILGGLVDLYFFTGPTPEEVIRQYHQVIGTPALPPYWALGLHQSKWGYPNLNYIKDVVANYSAANLPLETIWSDIDYMHNRYRNAEFDPYRYPVNQMSAFVEDLNAKGQHWIPILDAGVAVSQGYLAFEEGNRENVWIKDQTGVHTYVGQVWPGPSVYPDYLSSSTVGPWLERKVDRFHKQVPFSGLWLDMNEASNFCSGMNCEPDYDVPTNMFWLEMPVPKDGNISVLYSKLSTCVMKCQQAEPDNKIANPPYKLHNYKGPGEPRQAPLSSNVISPTAKHADGTLEYDAHNLYGAAMARSHYDATVAVTGKRPFLVSRSTFPGAGRYAAHWTGDNAGNWENLFYSISGIINSNIWGMPMVGADICGFIDATQDGDPWNNPNRLSDSDYEQLCNRWAQAGAFYTFSRNHMGYPARNHEFYRWPSVTAAAKKAYQLRYQLLTYMYSSLFTAHVKGGTVLRPLFFTAPSDVNARSAEEQWMVGEALLVSPVVHPNTTTIKPYFTPGAWYSAWDYSLLAIDGPTGQAVQMSVPLGEIAVHYRGGTIIPVQQYALVTQAVRYSPVTLVVALPGSTAAAKVSSSTSTVPPYAQEDFCRTTREQNPSSLVSCGTLFMDSEDDVVVVTSVNSVQATITAVTAADARSGHISSIVEANAGGAAGKLKVAAVHILGVGGDAATATVTANGMELSGSISRSTNAYVLKVEGLQLDIGQALDIHWAM